MTLLKTILTFASIIMVGAITVPVAAYIKEPEPIEIEDISEMVRGADIVAQVRVEKVERPEYGEVGTGIVEKIWKGELEEEELTAFTYNGYTWEDEPIFFKPGYDLYWSPEKETTEIVFGSYREGGLEVYRGFNLTEVVEEQEYQKEEREFAGQVQQYLNEHIEKEGKCYTDKQSKIKYCTTTEEDTKNPKLNKADLIIEGKITEKEELENGEIIVYIHHDEKLEQKKGKAIRAAAMIVGKEMADTIKIGTTYSIDAQYVQGKIVPIKERILEKGTKEYEEYKEILDSITYNKETSCYKYNDEEKEYCATTITEEKIIEEVVEESKSWFQNMKQWFKDLWNKLFQEEEENLETTEV